MVRVWVAAGASVVPPGADRVRRGLAAGAAGTRAAVPQGVHPGAVGRGEQADRRAEEAGARSRRTLLGTPGAHLRTLRTLRGLRA